MTQPETNVIAAWQKAADDLGIRFTTPSRVTTSDGRAVDYLGLVHQFGRRVGTLISVIGTYSQQPNITDEDYCVSELSPNYAEYNRQSFIDRLDDWQWTARRKIALHGIRENAGNDLGEEAQFRFLLCVLRASVV